ncbi:MAG: oligosaccharide flippase family protein [Nitrospinota bacterium]|nr:oligosaccharide flippase family protein [Nitrospinota bacterium]
MVETNTLKKTPKLRSNILANFAGKGWTALMALVFVPIYIDFIGIEAYGLVGIFLSLLALSTILDLGLSTSLNKELAHMSVHKENIAQDMNNMVRTLELVYWALAILIAGIIALSAPLLTEYWLSPKLLTEEQVFQAIVLMGLAIACQWPVTLYSGGLMGLQQQVKHNLILVVFSSLRAVGAIMVLWLISPTIQAFFIWQLIVSLLQTIATRITLKMCLPYSKFAGQFEFSLLKKLWRFAAGMTFISILAILLTQLDKIILSKMLSLEMFGYYTLGAMVATSVYVMVLPIQSALFPRFSQLVSKGDDKELGRLYHQSCQWVSLAVLPVAGLIALFSKQILLLWTGDQDIVTHTHALVSLLTIGSSLNAMMQLPYSLQLSHGWTKLALYMNLASVAVLIPCMAYLTSLYGAIGAAMVWVLLNAGYVLIGIQLMHRRLLKAEKWNWYLQDFATPLAGVLVVALPAYLWHPELNNVFAQLCWLVLTFISSLFMAALLTPVSRQALKRFTLVKA